MSKNYKAKKRTSFPKKKGGKKVKFKTYLIIFSRKRHFVFDDVQPKRQRKINDARSLFKFVINQIILGCE